MIDLYTFLIYRIYYPYGLRNARAIDSRIGRQLPENRPDDDDDPFGPAVILFARFLYTKS